MSLHRPLSVYRNPLADMLPEHPQFQGYVFRCDFCDRDMAFDCWRDAQSHAEAHGRKHADRACERCGSTPYIREDWA